MKKKRKTFTLVLPVDDSIAMREFERATGAIRCEIQPEAPAERVFSSVEAAATERYASGMDLNESYVLLSTSIAEIIKGRRVHVLTPSFAEFGKRLKRRLRDRQHREADMASRFAGHFESQLAPFLDEIRLDGLHLKSTLERIGTWHALPKKEQEDILALAPWMTVVFDDRTKAIHSLRFHPILPKSGADQPGG